MGTDKQHLSELEQLILLAIVRLGDNAYAVSIRREIEARAGRPLSRGTVYVTLDRMQRRGHVDSWFAAPTPERGGKAKKFYRVSPEARRALTVARDSLLTMWEGIEAAP